MVSAGRSRGHDYVVSSFDRLSGRGAAARLLDSVRDRETGDGVHRGSAVYVFADGAAGRNWHGGPVAEIRPDGTRLHWREKPPSRSVDEIVGWRAICSDGWVGPIWARVRNLPELDLVGRRLYWEDNRPFLRDEFTALVMSDWEKHVAPAVELDAVESAAADLADSQDRLAAAVRNARGAGASWADIGRKAGISRQSAHERWAKHIIE